MNPRLVILLSLLGFAVIIAIISFWLIARWQTTPVPHQMVVPSKEERMLQRGIVDAPFQVPEQTPTTPSKPPKAEMKINIDEVCQGALAYMTFADAASADAFVTDCKEGKHPEVIEQYKANLNVGDGAAI